MTPRQKYKNTPLWHASKITHVGPLSSIQAWWRIAWFKRPLKLSRVRHMTVEAATSWLALRARS
uniref:Uncharacterized protein n=1 Tax=Arundo donax TaxID=35708 RepID=A0A0A8YAE6_ARUDO